MSEQDVEKEREIVQRAICKLLSDDGVADSAGTFALHRVTGEYASYILIAADGCHESLESIFKNHSAFKPGNIKGVWILLPDDALSLLPCAPYRASEPEDGSCT